METEASFLLFLIVLSFISCGETNDRSSPIGCLIKKIKCNTDEYCCRVPFPGKCKKYITQQFNENELPHITYEDFINDHDTNLQDENEDDSYLKNSQYDMMYFRDPNYDTAGKNRVIARRNTKNNRRHLNNIGRLQNIRLLNDKHYVGPETFEKFDYLKKLKNDHWRPVPLTRTFSQKKIAPKRRRTGSSPNGNDNSPDFDFVIRPLSFSDVKKVKHSYIPHKPEEKETAENIEHVQTNMVETKLSKKAKVGTLIAGKLDKAKENIIVQKNPDQTYAKVKDFFKSQQVSSIVDAPVAERKEGIKFQSFSSDDKDANVKRSSIPSSPVYPDGIRLHTQKRINPGKIVNLLNTLQDQLWGSDVDKPAFKAVHVDDDVLLLRMINDTSTNGQEPSSVVERINRDKSLKSALHKAAGVKVVSASLESEQLKETKDKDTDFMITTLVVAGCVTGVLLVSVCIFIIVKRNENNHKWVLKPSGQEAASDYQSLWRQLRQATWDAPVQTPPVASSVEQKPYFGNKSWATKYSWGEEPVDTKMDISTGHVVLSYMEDHLKNENRLSKEWDDLSVYEAEPNESDVGKDPKNSKKNRYSDVLPYDHNRVKLRETSNATGSDYINASYIIDDDPHNPAYIATQGPLGSTVADFWQMVWEKGVAVIVMLTKLADLGLPQCHRYWPEKGNETYHIYQVHLISEHIWCSDYLVRSFYLKNIQTGETRTVTQFHFLSWPHLGIPASSKPLLDFRRKVLKSFRSLSSPVVVHCSGGIDRTGTYILIDMVLGKMLKGTKEIDIAATLEYLRDQRPGMVKTKAQFEFALTSVAEEVNAILLVLTKH